MKRMHVRRARALRAAMTEAEDLLWRYLRNRQLAGWKFRRQHDIDRYIADFVCPDAMLIVELDGGQHLEQASKDAVRTRKLESLGYRVLRFWNDEVLKQSEVVLEVILEGLESAAPHPNPLPGGERE